MWHEEEVEYRDWWIPPVYWPGITLIIVGVLVWVVALALSFLGSES